MLNSVMHCFECGRNVDFECGHRVETAADETYCCVCAGGEIDGLNEKIDALRVENDRLRALTRKLEEERRWRKWPDEKPECDSRIPYQVIHKGYSAQAVFTLNRWFLDEKRSDDDVTDEVTHWRSIGELPGCE